MKTLKIAFSYGLLVPALVSAENDVLKHNTVTNNGTTITTDSKYSESTSMAGTKKTVAAETTIKDPTGLNNKVIASKETNRSDKPNGDYTETTDTQHADQTAEKVTNKRSTARHWTDKGKTVTTTQQREVDPVGLGNKTTTEVSQVKDVRPDGTTAGEKVIKKVDGATVSETKVQR